MQLWMQNTGDWKSLAGEHIFNFLMHKNDCPTFLLETLIQISHNIQGCQSICDKKAEIPEKDMLFNAFKLH